MKEKLYRVIEGLESPDDKSDKVNKFLDEVWLLDDGRPKERLDFFLGAGFQVVLSLPVVSVAECEEVVDILSGVLTAVADIRWNLLRYCLWKPCSVRNCVNSKDVSDSARNFRMDSKVDKNMRLVDSVSNEEYFSCQASIVSWRIRRFA